MTYFTLSERLSLISQMTQVAKSDGHSNMAEVSYIVWTAQKFQLSELELGRIIEKSAPLSVPLSTKDRVIVLHHCTTLAGIDGQPLAAEVDKCCEISVDLRLEKSKVSELKNLLARYKGVQVPLPELLELYQ
jgi:hypothetical protein